MMKWMAIAAAVALGTAVLPTAQAEAAGCIKGAVVGGVAGHFLGHHGLLGATAGCLIGRHEANRHARQYYGYRQYDRDYRYRDYR